MAQETLSGGPLEDTDLMKKFLGNDAHILTDLQSYRKHDAHKLLRHLETLVRNNPKTTVKDVSQEEIHKYLACLVQVYFSCSESIKLSRAVEKLWQPYQDVYGDKIKVCFQKHLDGVVSEEAADNQALVRVSVLVEQNTMVQSVFADNLESYLTWAAGKLVSLTDIPPSELTKEEAQCLYSVVKICLQVFQTCGSTISRQAWSEDVGVSNMAVSMTTRQITERLIHILKTKGYSVDCVLLCGTATALLLNTFPDAWEAEIVFHRVFQVVLNQGTDIVFSLLWNEYSCTSTPSDIIEKLSKTTINELGSLALIRGCVACGRKEFLSFNSAWSENNLAEDSGHITDQKLLKDELNSKCVEEIMFIKLFRYICTVCEGDITVHYHAFQVLLLWFSRMTKLISTLESSIDNNFTSICEITLHLVLLNMDSPIEDVPEAVMEIFGHLLGIWNRFRDKGPDLPGIVLEKIMNTHWYVKGRYRLLSTLLKYTDTEKVISEYPQLQSELLQCLTTNHLTSAATSVYKAFLQEILKKYPEAEQHTEVWKNTWLPLIVKGLVAQDSLLRYNTSLHWIPATFKLLPSTSPVLQHHLSVAMATPDAGLCRTGLLHAWVVVTKTVRTQFGTSDLTDRHVLEALYCADEDVRSDAIALVCSTLKKAEFISEIEVRLLMGCLPHNIKIDSAPFRQQLGSNLKKLLVRLRDSCVTMLKDTDASGELLKRSISFVNWLHLLCIDNLLPGACYQRRKGSLDLLHVIYDTLIYCPDSRQRKGFTPETARKLVEFARSCGSWEFFTAENTKSLTLCLLDGADEIQTTAADLLTRYYPCLPEDTCRRLLRDALSLCSSPRSHESQSGALMCKYLFQNCIVEQGYKLGFLYDDSSGQYMVTTTGPDDNGNAWFLQCFLDEISRCWTLAQKNLVEASKQSPIHGLILALTKCLTEVDVIWRQEQPCLLPLTTHLVTCCCQVIDSMLEVMASVAGQEACPSFAEIGMALENLLLENQPDYTESTSLSVEYQYMLSYCWNNIKESCSCLGEVTSCLLGNGQSVEFRFIENICDTFIKVLTKCRHKGVIEGTRLAFIRFCSGLFIGPEGSLQQLPATVLTRVLLSLKNNVMTSSVTRRSAGIPIIIQAILVSEKKLKKTVLLAKAVDELFEISSIPLDTDSGLTDLPQVHGLNILNSLFGDASLTASLMGHISRTVILVIEKFGSPSWAIRNAATRLFSTLVTRLFGQRKEDISCNTVTFQEFSSYYPELPPFLQQVLSEASQCDIGAIDQLDPKLFPILTLLSCLKPMDNFDASLNSTVKSIKDQIFKFVESPVYQLRHLVAPALVAMVNMADMTTVAKECLALIYSSQKNCSCNKVHGLLLVVSKLLDNIHRSSDLSDLWVKLMQKRWIIEMPCIRAGLYAKLLNKILEKHSNLSERETITNLLLIILCPYNSKALDELPVGFPVLCCEIVALLFRVWECTGRSCIPLAPLLLSGTNTDIRKVCLECIKKQVESGRLTQSGLHHLQKTLVQHLKLENDIQNTFIVLELITELYHRTGELDDLDVLSRWLAENSVTLENYTSLASAALPVIGIVVRSKTQGGYSEAVQPLLLCSICDQIQMFSQDYNETKRHSGAVALQIAGECVLNLAVDLRLPWIEKAAVSVISACLTLIQDEDTDIRSQAAQFISSVRNLSSTIQFSSIQSNICYELFLDYIGRRFAWSAECCRLLCDQLYPQQSLPVILKQKTESRYQQLFDQEDNSFFAERLYNSMFIHRVLKGMMTSSGGQDTTLTVFLGTLSEGLSQDLDILLAAVEKLDKESVSSILSDSLVLGHICGLVLLADIVTMATNSDNCRAKQNVILQSDFLPRTCHAILGKNSVT